jgi:hypothetical protein
MGNGLSPPLNSRSRAETALASAKIGEHACAAGGRRRALPPAVTSLKRPRHRGCPKASGPDSTRRAGAISGRGWKRPFDDPIPLPRGRQLVTLEDAAK